MEQHLSYVFVTPYTIAKSRTGGVISRLLSRTDLELVGAQMIAFDEQFAKDYAAAIRGRHDPANSQAGQLLGDYIERNMAPSGGRAHRTLLLLFRGANPWGKLSDICGALYPENMGVESLTGETIRDTYADLIVSADNEEHVIYFEPAVLTPRSKELADNVLSLLASWLPGQKNIVENMQYAHPEKVERTLVIIKPDNWKFSSLRPGTIIDMFSRTGLRIIAVKVHRMSVTEALAFYGPLKESLCNKLAPVFAEKAKELLESEFAVHFSVEAQRMLKESLGKEYAQDQFAQVIEFMSGKRPDTCPLEERNQSGSVKCMVIVYEGENAVRKIRDVLGPTDPLLAPGGTVRREFGSNIMVNTAHASDSVENAKREMEILHLGENDCSLIIQSYLAMHSIQ